MLKSDKDTGFLKRLEARPFFRRTKQSDLLVAGVSLLLLCTR